MNIQLASDFFPQKNFSTPNNPEEELAVAFCSKYYESFSKIHSTNDACLFLREFPILSLGIADLAAVTFEENIPKRIRSFEFKISDWKGGLNQASRYKFYSDVSVLVMPHNKIKMASENLDTFKRFNVGLWSYNMKTGSIKSHFTPRPKKQFYEKYRSKAVKKIETLNCCELI